MRAGRGSQLPPIRADRTGSSKETGLEYRYDALDRRDYRLKDNNQAKRFDYAHVGTSEALTREVDAETGIAKRYDYDSSGQRQGQSKVSNSGTAEYRSFAYDAHGSVEWLESASGSKIERSEYRYDPYGELENEGQLSLEAKDNPFRFQSFYYDEGIGTYDMQARTYAPQLGRFLNQDRYEQAGADLHLQSDPLTQNRYAFVGGNPVSRIEWDGHVGTTGGWPGERGTHTINQNGEVRNSRSQPLNSSGVPLLAAAPQITEPSSVAAARQSLHRAQAARPSPFGLVDPATGLTSQERLELSARAALFAAKE